MSGLHRVKNQKSVTDESRFEDLPATSHHGHGQIVRRALSQEQTSGQTGRTTARQVAPTTYLSTSDFLDAPHPNPKTVLCFELFEPAQLQTRHSHSGHN